MPQHTVPSGLFCRWTSSDLWDCYEANTENSAVHSTLQTKLAFAIKTYVERKILLRGPSLLHPLEKLDRSVEELRIWLLDRLHVVGVEFALLRGTEFLLYFSHPKFSKKNDEIDASLARTSFEAASSVMPLRCTISWDCDGFSGWFSQLHCIHLSATCLPTEHMLVRPSATWNIPC